MCAGYTEIFRYSRKASLILSQFESKFEEDLYQLRRDKLAQIAAIVRAGNPEILEAEARFPNSFAFTQTVPELRTIGDPKSTEELEAGRIEAAIAGRIMAIRVQGKAGFAQIQQGGQRLQIYVRKDDVGEDIFALYKLLDLGDHIGVRGYLMRTRTGELTLHAAAVDGKPAIVFLTKAMLALPDKYHGLEDVELRYRQRYVDLIMNSGTRVEAGSGAQPGETAGLSTAAAKAPPSVEMTNLGSGEDANEQHDEAPLNVREVFVKRAAILRAIRRFFDERGYLEVETPMLHTVAGGAAARPFKTHHNALDVPLSLRIAPELYLKRLVVGGLDRVYEINRNFRNEGVSTRHNPEFTMLEFYQAYANYHDLMELTQELISSVAVDVNGSTVTRFNGVEIDLGKWTKLSMREAIIKFWPKSLRHRITENDLKDEESAQAFVQSVEEELNHGLFPGVRMEIDGVRVTDLISAVTQLWSSMGLGKAIANLFELLAEPYLIQPTIIYDFPLAVSPLSKVKPDEPDWVERFEFYIGGFEVGNAFSELNDADDQRRRFLAQLEEKERGDDEAHEMDEDYVRALGYGLPPTAGEGIGIDRLTMLLTGSRSIRDVILFPLMRPKAVVVEGESAE
jgi:lysyl-tRNA synthetase class 2